MTFDSNGQRVMTEITDAVPVVPLKREFIATWDRSEVSVHDSISFQAKQFFQQNVSRGYDTTKTMHHPIGIRYNDLAPFFGRKTKITIELVD